MTDYVALLRGINVGGKHRVEMTRLRAVLEGYGYTQVKTLLNSGNILFEAHESDTAVLTRQVEALLQETFGFPIPTLLRTQAELHELIASVPFHGIPVTENTRLYVTFLSEPPRGPVLAVGPTPDASFQIVRVTDREVCSVLTVDPANRSIDAMNILELTYGSRVTTRNWNTVVKLRREGGGERDKG